MSERKVLTKYYPPDFDPSKVARTRKSKDAGPRVQTVRLMAPYSMRCLSCGEFIYKGRKFNARKETPPDERYLGIQIYRFYIRCTRCSAEITFKTDPKNNDYTAERGAKRNVEPWRAGGDEETDEQRLDRLEREAAAEDGEGLEERNVMAELESKMNDARREMEVADALDEIQMRNARIERGRREGADVELGPVAGEDAAEADRRRQEQEDEEAARKAFSFARAQEASWEVIEEDADGEAREEDAEVSSATGSLSSGTAASITPSTADTVPISATKAAEMPPPPPSFKRQVKKKKDHAALLGIKKKPSLV